jgi:hypothetical protein
VITHIRDTVAAAAQCDAVAVLPHFLSREEAFRDEPERMNAKIKRAQLFKVPYMLILRDREAADGTVSLRRRDRTQADGLAIDAFVDGPGQGIAALSRPVAFATCTRAERPVRRSSGGVRTGLRDHQRVAVRIRQAELSGGQVFRVGDLAGLDAFRKQAVA